MKTKQGIVVSDRNNKTIVVRVDRYVKHPKYQKRYRLSKKFHVHDEANTAEVGDLVEIQESRPLSKLKRWTLVTILKKSARIVQAQPGAVESESEAELRALAQKEVTPPVEQKPAPEAKTKSE